MALTRIKQNFADAFMQTQDVAKAGIAAGMNRSKALVIGERYLKDPDVLQYMLIIGKGKKEVTPETLTDEFNEAIALAKVYRQPSAMVAAIKAKAQLHGYLIDKVDHSGTIKHDHDVKVSKVDLDERRQQIIEGELSNVLQ